MGSITFILGGARSGKSHHAALLAAKANRKSVVYIATGEAKDTEMKSRIAHHKRSRPVHWKTFEEPLRISRLIDTIGNPGSAIVLDCLTLLVTNLMLRKLTQAAIEGEARLIVEKLRARKGRSFIVSNEVGLGIVPANRLARAFRDIAGSVNKIVAELSDEVIFMVSGIPMKIK